MLKIQLCHQRSRLHSQTLVQWKIVILLISHFIIVLTVFLDQINAALIIIRDFFKN